MNAVGRGPSSNAAKKAQIDRSRAVAAASPPRQVESVASGKLCCYCTHKRHAREGRKRTKRMKRETVVVVGEIVHDINRREKERELGEGKKTSFRLPPGPARAAPSSHCSAGCVCQISSRLLPGVSASYTLRLARIILDACDATSLGGVWLRWSRSMLLLMAE